MGVTLPKMYSTFAYRFSILVHRDRRILNLRNDTPQERNLYLDMGDEALEN